MHLTLHIWRQRGSGLPGGFVRYAMTDVSPDMSFLEMLDVLNQQLLARKDEPIAFDHDCREGICGMCGMVINGRPHGPQRATTTCQLHMRSFPDRAELWIEPWRAGAFPVIKDLVRSEEHTSELQSPCNLVCRLLLEKKKKKTVRMRYCN